MSVALLLLLFVAANAALAQKSFGELWKEFSGDQKTIPPPSTKGDNLSKLKALRELLRERLLEKEDEGLKIDAHKNLKKIVLFSY